MQRGTAPATISFDDVSPSPEAADELTWFFNEAECAIGVLSANAALIEGVKHMSLERAEACAEAVHAAHEIWTRLKAISVADARVLEGLCAERCWPALLVARLGRLAGVVEGMPAVRAQYLAAVVQRHTCATDVTSWLEELAAHGAASLAGWNDEARRACAAAISAYELARGDGPSVVPREDG